MPSPEAQKLQQQFALAPKDITLTLEEQRQFCEMFGELTAEPEGITYQAAQIDEVPAEWAEASGADRTRAIVYVHGGGFIMGSVGMYRRLVGHLARACGCPVVSLEYRLAPEHPFPAGLNDVSNSVEQLIKSLGAERVAVVGDSAGGGLAQSAVLSLRDRGAQVPAAVATMSAWTDLACTGGSYRSRAAQDPLASPEAGPATAARYLGDSPPDHPLASPAYADFTGLPPLLMQVGDFEVLLDDSVRVARAASEVGVPVELQVWPEMHHVFQLAAGVIPEADRALAELGGWLRDQLGLT